MIKLMEMYLNTEPVSFDDIPDDWRKSFTEFMFGQAGPIIDGVHMAYNHDYKRWFNENQKAILRDIKIDEIIKHKKNPH
jgi:hypothetical protein